MKITKQGQKVADMIYEMECGTCDTVFEFNRNEAVFRSNDINSNCLIIECPNCHVVCQKCASNYKGKKVSEF